MIDHLRAPYLEDSQSNEHLVLKITNNNTKAKHRKVRFDDKKFFAAISSINSKFGHGHQQFAEKSSENIQQPVIRPVVEYFDEPFRRNVGDHAQAQYYPVEQTQKLQIMSPIESPPSYQFMSPLSHKFMSPPSYRFMSPLSHKFMSPSNHRIMSPTESSFLESPSSHKIMSPTESSFFESPSYHRIMSPTESSFFESPSYHKLMFPMESPPNYQLMSPPYHKFMSLVQTESQQAESQQTELQQAESLVQTESQQAESQQTELQQAESLVQTESQQTESQQTELQQAESQQAESQQAESLVQTESQQAESLVQTESQQAESQQTELQQAESLVQTDSQQTESQQTESQQTESQQTESQQTESQQAELQQIESLVQTESLFQTDSQQTSTNISIESQIPKGMNINLNEVSDDETIDTQNIDDLDSEMVIEYDEPVEQLDQIEVVGENAQQRSKSEIEENLIIPINEDIRANILLEDFKNTLFSCSKDNGIQFENCNIDIYGLANPKTVTKKSKILISNEMKLYIEDFTNLQTPFISPITCNIDDLDNCSVVQSKRQVIANNNTITSSQMKRLNEALETYKSQGSLPFHILSQIIPRNIYLPLLDEYRQVVDATQVPQILSRLSMLHKCNNHNASQILSRLSMLHKCNNRNALQILSRLSMLHKCNNHNALQILNRLSMLHKKI